MNIINHFRSSSQMSASEFDQAIQPHLSSDSIDLRSAEALITRRVNGIKNELEKMGAKNITEILKAGAEKTAEFALKLKSIDSIFLKAQKAIEKIVTPYTAKLANTEIQKRFENFKSKIENHFGNATPINGYNSALAALKEWSATFHKLPLSVNSSTYLSDQYDLLKNEIEKAAAAKQVSKIKSLFEKFANDYRAPVEEVNTNANNVFDTFLKGRNLALANNNGYSPGRVFAEFLKNKETALLPHQDLFGKNQYAAVWTEIDQGYQDLHKILNLPYETSSFQAPEKILDQLSRAYGKANTVRQAAIIAEKNTKALKKLEEGLASVKTCLSLHKDITDKANALNSQISSFEEEYLFKYSDQELLNAALANIKQKKDDLATTFFNYNEAVQNITSIDNLLQRHVNGPITPIDYSPLTADASNQLAEFTTQVKNLESQVNLLERFSAGNFTDLKAQDFTITSPRIYARINLSEAVYDRLKGIITAKLSKDAPKEARLLYKKNLKNWLNSQEKALQEKFSGMSELNWTFAESFFRFLSWIADLFKREESPKKAVEPPAAPILPAEDRESAAAPESSSSSLDGLILSDDDFEPDEGRGGNLVQQYQDADWVPLRDDTRDDNRLNPFSSDIQGSNSQGLDSSSS